MRVGVERLPSQCTEGAGGGAGLRRTADPEAYSYIQDPRVIEQRALLVKDEALRQAFCVATSGEEIIQRFEAFIEAGCTHILWADMSPDPSLVAKVCAAEVLPYLKKMYGSAIPQPA